MWLYLTAILWYFHILWYCHGKTQICFHVFPEKPVVIYSLKIISLFFFFLVIGNMRRNIVKYPKVNKPSWQSKLVLIYMQFYKLRDFGLKLNFLNPKNNFRTFCFLCLLNIVCCFFIAVINFPKPLKSCIFISLMVINFLKEFTSTW